MILKAWACFDGDGDVIQICTEQENCDILDCEEYIIKFQKINRKVSDILELESAAKEVKKAAKDFDKASRSLKRSINKFKV